MALSTPLYAGLLAVLFLFLSWQVIALRQRRNLSVGDGGDAAMLKAVRVQANCAEYSGLGLILLLLAELQGAPGWLIHGLGATLLAGRVLHAVGMGRSPQIMPARVAGMILTLSMIGIAAIANIGHSIF